MKKHLHRTLTHIYPLLSPFQTHSMALRYACYDMIDFYVQHVHENTKNKGHWSSHRMDATQFTLYISPTAEREYNEYSEPLDKKLASFVSSHGFG